MLIRKSAVAAYVPLLSIVSTSLLVSCGGNDAAPDTLGAYFPEHPAGGGSPNAGSSNLGAGMPSAGSPPALGHAGGSSGNAGSQVTGGAANSTSGSNAGRPAAAGNSARGGTSGAASSGGAGGRGSAGTSGGEGLAGAASRCTGKPGAIRGASNQTLTAARLQRTFVYYAPPTLDPNEPVPIVIVAHGWLMNGQQMYDITQYDQIADKEGFVVMFPDGEPASIGPWNVGADACPSTLGVLPVGTGDDQAFIDAMISFTSDDQCVDRRHVFLTGFSMGAYFANETGCLRPDIAAVAPHSGGSHDFAGCPTLHKPVILFHGTADGLIPTTCGTQARDRWVALNGCSTDVDSVDVMGGHCEYSKDCPVDGQVVLCLFDGMDHGWAGGQGAANAFPNYASASVLGWDFFKKYAW